jgi:hypothetical protein
MNRPYRRQGDWERAEGKNNGPGQGFEAVVAEPEAKTDGSGSGSDAAAALFHSHGAQLL